MASAGAFCRCRRSWRLRELPLLAWLGLSLLAPASPLAALDPIKAIGQYSLSSWEVDDGLPHSTVYSVAQTPDGYLWLGTGGGLVRFDGVRFTLFDRYNTPEISNPHIWDLVVDKQGSLWIATNGGGVVELTEGRFRAFGTAEGLPGLRILDLEPSRGGGVWVATFGGGLSRVHNGVVTRWTNPAVVGGDDLFAVEETRDGTVWIGTRSADVFRFEDGVFHRLTTTGQLSGNPVWKILEDRRGDLWIATSGGLYRLPGGRWEGTIEAFRPPEPIAHDTVLDIHEDHDGNLWLGTAGGLSRRSPEGTFTSFGSAGGLPSPTLWSVFEDSDGNLWLGSSGGGVSRLRDGDFIALDHEQGLSSNHVTSIYEDTRGSLWVTTHDGGLNRLQNGVWSNFTLRDGLPYDDLWSVLGDRAGNLWIGTNGRGLTRWRDGVFTTFTQADGLVNDSILALYEDRGGSLWLGTNGGLGRLQDGVFSHWTEADGLPGDHVRSLLEDLRGDLWIGTAQGLGRLREGAFSRYTTTEGLTSNNVWAMTEQPPGTLWLGTAGGGLNRLRDGKFDAITVHHGLPSDSVLSLLPDDLGNLWLCTGQGVMRVAVEELTAVADGRKPTLSGIVFGPADGLKTSECQGGSQPTAWRGAGGKLYFATLKGIAVTDPNRLRPSPTAPRVHVEAILLDGERQPDTSSIEVRPGVKHLEIQYTALSFRAPSRLQFRYQLEGFDRGWIDVGTRRTAFYTRLSPGNYTFRVDAREGDGTFGTDPGGAVCTFVVKPHLYETMPFLLLIGALVFAAAFLFHRLRLARLERRERELARRVEESLAQIKILSGMLPICASCKKVRDDQGYWSEIETYVTEHSEAELSHSLCPECVAELYTDQLKILSETAAVTESKRSDA